MSYQPKGLPKAWLLVSNGLIWGAAGVNILRLGIASWAVSDLHVALTASLAVTIFLAFHFMFTSIVRKNVLRIRSSSQSRMPLWNMMPLKSWLVLAFMMSLGITLKVTGVASPSFVAFFYTGLGSALTECGLLYIYRGATL